MPDHAEQKLSAREMVRAHAYPVLAAISSISLVVMAVSLLPLARQSSQWAECFEHNVSFNSKRFADAGMSPSEARAWATRFCNGGGGAAMPRAQN